MKPPAATISPAPTVSVKLQGANAATQEAANAHAQRIFAKLLAGLSNEEKADPQRLDNLQAELHQLVTAELTVQPELLAALVQREHSPEPNGLCADLEALTTRLQRTNAAIQAGDMSAPESMLYAQAEALNAIFTQLALRSTSSQVMPQMREYLSLALKAQSNCRSTLEALAYLRNPPNPTFIRQQNNAQNQQVNNARADRRPGKRTKRRALEHAPGGRAE